RGPTREQPEQKQHAHAQLPEHDQVAEQLDVRQHRVLEKSAIEVEGRACMQVLLDESACALVGAEAGLQLADALAQHDSADHHAGEEAGKQGLGIVHITREYWSMVSFQTGTPQ